MSQIIAVPEQTERLNVRNERLSDLSEQVHEEIEDAFAGRSQLEAEWRNCLRMYEGKPKAEVKNVPVENAPNYEIPVGAIAADSIYAQSIDLVWQISPTITVRANSSDRSLTNAAKALQRFVSWGVLNEWEVRPATDNAFLDDIQLGTSVYYCPWVERMRRTRADQIVRRGPRVITVPIQDFLVPGGSSSNLQEIRWCSFRYWLSLAELNRRAQRMDWNIQGTQAAGALDQIRQQRETHGKQRQTGTAEYDLYEVMDIYGYFDVNRDGLLEDVLLNYDRTSGRVMKARWNPFEMRPFEAMRYQQRPHLFYGFGTLKMLESFEEEISEVHNHRILNMLLANTRLLLGREGEIDEDMPIWPGKIITSPNPEGALTAIAMADVYPSSAQAEQIAMAYAERRVGVSDVTASRPGNVLGTRTPGITALSMLQTINRRFTPAFDSMRLGTAGAVRQCLYRYQERLLAGDVRAEQRIINVLGEQDGQQVIGLLKDPDFDESITVELTASSASVNKDADRQNAMILINILSQYYERVVQLVTIAANPQVPEAIREVAKRISEASGEAIERTIRTFDQVRDPATFIVNFEDVLEQGTQGLQQNGLQGLAQILGAAGGTSQEPLLIGQ